jgi:hypothetical protein
MEVGEGRPEGGEFVPGGRRQLWAEQLVDDFQIALTPGQIAQRFPGRPDFFGRT